MLFLPKIAAEDILVLFHITLYAEGSFLQEGFGTFPNFSEKRYLLPISEKVLQTSFVDNSKVN
jgi:hypothetical protein